MDYFQMMDWNTKWECEDLDIFCSKSNGTPKKLQVADWLVEEGETTGGSFNLFGSSSCSASDIGHVSSAKSSISASTECSSEEGIRASNFIINSFGGFLPDFTKKKELETAELPRTSLSVDTSVGSSELLMGLKLGKRTYFENSSAGNSSTTSSKIPVSSALTTKKSRLICQNAPTTKCQVEACNLDLSSAKEYHRKHRVCESHTKCSKVIVGGLERRFCQQCSRFHSLSEFDEKKRSCRRRLSDHNARRRKPQHETVHFNSTCKSLLTHEGGQQMSFVSSSATGPSESSTWESMHTSKYALPTGYLLKPEISSVVDVQSHLSGCQLPSPTNIPSQSTSKLLQCKITAEGFSQGSHESMLPSNLNTAADLHRALSLLSTDSSGSCDQGSVGLNHFTNASYKNIPNHVVRALPQSLPFASPECWQTEVQPSETSTHAFAANSNYGSDNQQVQLFSASYSTDFCSD